MEICHSCSFNYFQIVAQFYENNEASLNFLKEHGVIPISVNCHKCGKACTYRESKRMWRCVNRYVVDGQNKHCNFNISECKNTFLENTRLPLWKILLFVNHFLSPGWSHNIIRECLNLSTTTSVEWRSNCSQVTHHWVLNHQSQIGGEQIEVEIDETIIVCKGTKKGVILNQLWLFGGIERVSKKRFVVYQAGKVKDSSGREDISKLIQKFIKPGSIIYSDSLGDYYNLSELGYKHYCVNDCDSLNKPHVHTANIEKLWKDIKDLVKMPGIRGEYITEYLSRYLFMKSFNDNSVMFHKFFELCAELYPSAAGKNTYLQPSEVEDTIVVNQEAMEEA